MFSNIPLSEKRGKGVEKMAKKSNFMRKYKGSAELSLMALPGFLWFLIFSYIPMFGIIIAFKDYKYSEGILGSKWVGLDNFKYLFASNDAFRIVRNTVCYNLVFIFLGMAAAITVAIMLDVLAKRYLVKIYQTALFVPYFISWVLVAYIAQALFEYDGGVINTLLGKKITWYTNPKPWPIVIIIANLWKTIGYNVILYYGAIMGIDDSLYEAATIDGASRWRMIRSITIPMLRPTMTILAIMGIGGMMRADFGLFYYVPNNSGALYATTDVLDTYIYRILKVSGDMSGGSAAGLFQSVVGLILVITTNAIVRKIDSENALY